MARVTITINGRKFALGCDDGEEDRLLYLGEKLDARVNMLADQFGQIGDLRLLLMAGITLLDEIDDSQGNAHAQAKSMTEDIRRTSELAIQRAQDAEQKAAEKLTEAADRIKSLTDTLKSSH